MKKIIIGLTLFFLALSSTVASAELTPEQKYVQFTSAAMELTEDQKPLFDKCLADFMGDIKKVLYKDYKGASQTRKDAKIKAGITLLWEEWDGPVREIIRDDQWVAFGYYKGALSALMLAQHYQF